MAAAAIERREQVEAEAEAAADRGRQEGVVGAGHLVILEVAVTVALRLADHDARRGSVERGRQQVVRHVDHQPARAEHRHQLVLAQQREEVEAQGQQPEEHRHEEREMHRALVPARGDGDPEGGAGQQLQQPQYAQRAAQEGPLQAHRAAGRARLGRRLARGRWKHGPRARWRRRRRPEQRNGDVWLAGAARPTCPCARPASSLPPATRALLCGVPHPSQQFPGSVALPPGWSPLLSPPLAPLLPLAFTRQRQHQLCVSGRLLH